MNKLHALSFGYAGAIFSMILMLLLGILGNFGVYMGHVRMMSQWHMSFSLSFWGVVGGMIEGALISFALFYVFALLYNWLLGSQKKNK